MSVASAINASPQNEKIVKISTAEVNNIEFLKLIILTT